MALLAQAYPAVPIGIFIFSQTSWVVSFGLTKWNLMKDQLTVFGSGVICLVAVTLGPFLLFRKYFKHVDPLMYVFSVFAWACMIDLSIGLELDGYISNFMGFYFAEGEPYLMTAHGAAVCYWDGVVHFALYITMIALYSRKKSYRNVGLYWVGTMLNSMIVLLQGGVAGNHPFKLSILLNVPFALLPLLAAFKFLQDRPQLKLSSKSHSPSRHPVDYIFILYFLAAIFLAVFRGMAVLGGNADAMKEYLQTFEPYLLDPTNFPKFQVLMYGYFFFVYYLNTLHGLLYPGQNWMADWSLIHAGAAAQAQFTYLLASCNHRTGEAFQSPKAGSPALVFWSINLILFVVPHIFAWWCLNKNNRPLQPASLDRSKLVAAEQVKKLPKNKARKND